MANVNRFNQQVGEFDKTPNLKLNEVKIAMRNFRGLDYNGYNPLHKRTFWLLLDPERFDIQAMQDDGWNIREIKPREGHEDDPVMYRLEVEMRYDNYPPVIHMVTKKDNGKYKRTLMTEKSAELFDSAEIVNVNLEISHGKTWHKDGRKGIKAYLKKAQIEVVTDDFDTYYDFEDDDFTDVDDVPFE